MNDGGSEAAEHGRERTVPIEVLLLDVGGVLIPPADPSLLRSLEARLSLAPGGVERLLYECHPWYALSTGELVEPAYWRAIAAAAGQEPAELAQLLRPLWDRDSLDEAVIEVIRGIPARRAILSNATMGLEEWLRARSLDHLFDPVINSARIGLRKPDPRCFQRAVEILGVPPDTILFVDDKERNTRVAEQVGIPSVRFVDAPGLARVLRRNGLLA